MIHLVIQGKPLGKQRVKQGAMKGGHATLYTPMQTVNWEVLVKLMFMDKYPKWVPWEKSVPLSSFICAYYPIADGKPKKIKEAMSSGVIKPTVKPDADNIEKITWDALNQIAYADDCQIVSWGGGKFYSEQPRVEIWIRKMSSISDL